MNVLFPMKRIKTCLNAKLVVTCAPWCLNSAHCNPWFHTEIPDRTDVSPSDRHEDPTHSLGTYSCNFWIYKAKKITWKSQDDKYSADKRSKSRMWECQLFFCRYHFCEKCFNEIQGDSVTLGDDPAQPQTWVIMSKGISFDLIFLIY